MVAAVQVDTITFNSQIVEIRGKIGPKHIIIHADNDVGPETNTDGIALLSSGKTYLMALLPPFLATKFGLGDVIQVPLKCPKIYKATNIHNNNVYPITKDVFNHVVTPSLDDLKDTPIYWMKL